MYKTFKDNLLINSFPHQSEKVVENKLLRIKNYLMIYIECNRCLQTEIRTNKRFRRILSFVCSSYGKATRVFSLFELAKSKKFD